MRLSRKNQQGITLIELLIALAVGSLLLAGLTNIFITQRKIYANQEQIIEAQENLRWGLDIMAREIAMAGYDPLETSGASIVAASANSFQFTMDLNRNGNTADANEQVTYGLYDADGDGDQDLGRDIGGGYQLVAENIASLSFLYTLADGTTAPNPGDTSQIRAILITITTRTAKPDPQYPINGGYRTRTLATSIEVRNLRL